MQRQWGKKHKPDYTEWPGSTRPSSNSEALLALYSSTSIKASNINSFLSWKGTNYWLVIRQISDREDQDINQKLEKSPVKSHSPSQSQNPANRTGLHKCFAHLNVERQTVKLQLFPRGKYSSHLRTGRKTYTLKVKNSWHVHCLLLYTW